MTPKRVVAVNWAMRSIRRNRRGLAEIVGTLMLVVIVVAAATAFSFFVAAYQKQLQAEETLNHDKALENLRVFDLYPTVNLSAPPNLTSLLVDVASLDVNTIVIDGIAINGYAVDTYTVANSMGAPLSPPECLNGNPTIPYNTSCVLTLPAEAQVYLEFNLEFEKTYALVTDTTFTENGPIQFAFFTDLGNDFVQAFVPPVAVAGLTAVDGYPILDGTNSYQPPTNSTEVVTIDQWAWSVTGRLNDSNCTDDNVYSGQEVELHKPFESNCSYTIYLNVTNSEFLIGSTFISYTAPPGLA